MVSFYSKSFCIIGNLSVFAGQTQPDGRLLCGRARKKSERAPAARRSYGEATLRGTACRERLQQPSQRCRAAAARQSRHDRQRPNGTPQPANAQPSCGVGFATHARAGRKQTPAECKSDHGAHCRREGRGCGRRATEGAMPSGARRNYRAGQGATAAGQAVCAVPAPADAPTRGTPSM